MRDISRTYDVSHGTTMGWWLSQVGHYYKRRMG
jgi:hypothetical protein